MSSEMEAETSKRRIRPFVLVKGEFTSGTVRLWTGLGPIVWDGETYLGAGDMLGLSQVEETTETRAAGSTFVLSGVSAALLSIALQEDYQGRPIRAWLGALDAAGAIVVDPVQILRGRMDVMTPAADGKTISIALTAESRLAALERPKPRRYTPEDQHIDYPDDTFFDFVAGLQNEQIVWGGF